MRGLLRAEGYKLVRDRVFWTTLVAIIVFNLIVLSGSTIFSASGYKALKDTMKREILTILISCIYGGLFIGGDFADRTMYQALMTGKSRSAALLAKATAFLIANDILLFIFPLLLVLLCTGLNGWGALGAAPHIAGVAAALLILGFAIGTLSLLMAVCFRDIQRTIGFTIVLYFVMILLLNGQYSAALSHVFPAGALLLVVDGAISPSYGILVGAAWTVSLLTVSLLIFRHAELR